MNRAITAPAGEGSAGSSSQLERTANTRVSGRPEEVVAGGRAGRSADMRAASDDEILGIGTGSAAETRCDQGAFDREAEADHNVAAQGSDANPRAEQTKELHENTEASGLEETLAANPELRQAWDDAKAYRESFRTPTDARTATVALADLARMDALFFSGKPQDHAELARVVASLDPAAFQSLAKTMAEVASQAQEKVSDGSSAENGAGREQQEGQPGGHGGVEPSSQRGVTPAQEEFFHSTNAAAVRAVIDSIESQVERLLPAEISKGARNRLVGEIYHELDASLRADRQFASQAREAFRSGTLDEEHRQAVVALVNNRARQALPAVARRVLNEWTSAIVAANQDRRARQRAAERRVDIVGSGRTGNDGVRPTTPKDINYSRMSDADILNL